MQKRTTEGELAQIIARQGYGIAKAFPKKTIGGAFGRARTEHDVEPDSKSSFQGQKKLQINYTGKAIVSIKFYRHRLADYSRAISEKALIDALCYAGALRGDSEKEIRLIDLGQEKVGTKQEERTEVTIEYPDVDFENLFVADGRTDGR
jgi:hypothetical protein